MGPPREARQERLALCAVSGSVYFPAPAVEETDCSGMAQPDDMAGWPAQVGAVGDALRPPPEAATQASSDASRASYCVPSEGGLGHAAVTAWASQEQGQFPRHAWLAGPSFIPSGAQLSSVDSYFVKQEIAGSTLHCTLPSLSAELGSTDVIPAWMNSAAIGATLPFRMPTAASALSCMAVSSALLTPWMNNGASALAVSSFAMPTVTSTLPMAAPSVPFTMATTTALRPLTWPTLPVTVASTACLDSSWIETTNSLASSLPSEEHMPATMRLLNVPLASQCSRPVVTMAALQCPEQMNYLTMQALMAKLDSRLYYYELLPERELRMLVSLLRSNGSEGTSRLLAHAHLFLHEFNAAVENYLLALHKDPLAAIELWYGLGICAYRLDSFDW